MAGDLIACPLLLLMPGYAPHCWLDRTGPARPVMPTTDCCGLVSRCKHSEAREVELSRRVARERRAEEAARFRLRREREKAGVR